MAPLRFDRRHIERWASFSGDRNPIHFDRASARRLGVEDVVVHGMLPLLHAKTLCYRALREARGARTVSADANLTWNARLKRPLLVEDEAFLRFDAETGRFALVAGKTEATLFHGALGRASEPTPDNDRCADSSAIFVSIDPIVMDKASVALRRSELHEKLPEVATYSWVALSAIAFAEYLRWGTGRMRNAALDRLFGAALPENLDESITVVQTTHAVGFREAALERFERDPGACTITFSPVGIYMVDGGCSGTAHFQVRSAEESLLQLSVGLMLRVANVALPNPQPLATTGEPIDRPGKHVAT